jgi:hypothetical protein
MQKEITATASSFADPEDVARYHRARETGLTFEQSLRVGDNGVGKWGDITAQTHTPMVALAPSVLRSRWGSLKQAHRKPVNVTLGQRTVRAIVADIMPERHSGITKAGIDLNPAASKALALKPPHMVTVTWSWAI